MGLAEDREVGSVDGASAGRALRVGPEVAPRSGRAMTDADSTDSVKSTESDGTVPGTLFDRAITIAGSPTVKAAQLIAYDLEQHTDAEDQQVAEQMEGLDLGEHMAITAAIIAHAKAKYQPVATLGCYSGGNDSTTFMHRLRGDMDHAVHANTGIGIAETRVFVRDTCAEWGMPLIEGSPPPGCTYRELVLKYGFPGPAQHHVMFTRLKERAIRGFRRQFVTNGRKQRVLFLSGMRRFESDRRFENTQVLHRDGSEVWCSPLAWWTTEHMAEYRRQFDVPVNEVSVHLHMSGECLCGAYAKPGEKEEIRFFFPDAAEEIDALEDEVAAAGHAACVWGQRPPPSQRASYPTEQQELFVNPLCAKCPTRMAIPS